MCILVHAVKRQPDQSNLEERISDALVEVGPSITLASFAEILAFAVSAINPTPATRVFSMFAGWFLYIGLVVSLLVAFGILQPTLSCAALAVFMDFLLQVTAFVALIVFDFRRAQDGRIDCVPCARITPSSGAGDGK
jgi:Niemann-Pick C1 protein